jgi:hypothetical protein
VFTEANQVIIYNAALPIFHHLIIPDPFIIPHIIKIAREKNLHEPWHDNRGDKQIDQLIEEIIDAVPEA